MISWCLFVWSHNHHLHHILGGKSNGCDARLVALNAIHGPTLLDPKIYYLQHLTASHSLSFSSSKMGSKNQNKPPFQHTTTLTTTSTITPSSLKVSSFLFLFLSSICLWLKYRGLFAFHNVFDKDSIFMFFLLMGMLCFSIWIPNLL